MRRGLVHTTAWVLATGAAVALSWYGVRTVLTSTAYDPPRARPLAAAERPGEGNRSSSTHRPRPAAPSTTPPATARPTVPATPDRDGGASGPAPDRSSRTPERGGGARGYHVDGGRVVFDIGPASAELVSATPDSGWRMQTWQQDKWIRVDFVSGADITSVFCTWHDGPPKVEVD